MPIPIATEIWIDKPPEEVFAFITDIANWPQIMPTMVECRLLDDRPMAEGSQIEITVAFLGSTMTLETQITHWNPPHGYGSSNVDEAPMMTNLRTTLTAERGGTRLKRVDELEPKRFLVHLAAPLIQRAVSRNSQSEFENIKEILEKGEVSTNR